MKPKFIQQPFVNVQHVLRNRWIGYASFDDFFLFMIVNIHPRRFWNISIHKTIKKRKRLFNILVVSIQQQKALSSTVEEFLLTTKKLQ
ncbi:hypothetical protein CEXT_78221 [Caerostris extrusa]|uniref:Uncharacterized protein n=1 Tax=Caerostris extrusa TaxID=172846 RepID=A0AAV4WX77_CAEEX|nr:hypothetical protein CEXT_78221 [Caerostris extrusa]